jgi:hypothetical protein
MTTFKDGWNQLLSGFGKSWNRYQTKPGKTQVAMTISVLGVVLFGGVVLFRATSENAGVTEPVGLIDLGIQPESEPTPEAPMAPVEPVVCSEQRLAQQQLEEFLAQSDTAKQEISRLILEIADSRGPARKDWSTTQALRSEEQETGLTVLLKSYADVSTQLYELMEDGSISTDAETVNQALPLLWQLLEHLEGTEAYLKDNSKGRLDFVIASDAYARADEAYRAAKALQSRRQLELATMDTEGGCNPNVDTSELN